MLAVFWVFLGGGLGSAARYLTSNLGVKWLPRLPFLGTLLVNIIGCALLGFLLIFYRNHIQDGYAKKLWARPDFWQRVYIPLIFIGFCGGFTTFSSYILDVYTQFMNGRFWLAYLLLAAHVVLGLLAAGLGIWLALRLNH